MAEREQKKKAAPSRTEEVVEEEVAPSGQGDKLRSPRLELCQFTSVLDSLNAVRHSIPVKSR